MWAALKDYAAHHGFTTAHTDHPLYQEALSAPKTAAHLPELPAPIPPPHDLFAPGSSLLVRAPLDTPATTLRPATDALNSVAVRSGMSEVVEFETDLFRGVMRVCFRLDEGDMCARAAQLLAGKKRLIWMSIQVWGSGLGRWVGWVGEGLVG